MKKLAVLSVAGLMSVTASAVDWSFIGESKRVTAYIDADSISNSGGYKTAFVRFNLTKDEMNLKEYDSLTVFQEFDCRANPIKYKTLSSIARNGGQTVWLADAELNWNLAYPDSLAETISDFVCSH